MEGTTKLTFARNLQPGAVVRLSGARFVPVRSAAFEGGQLICGGPENKTATAIRITTEDGASFLVHPGQKVGIKTP